MQTLMASTSTINEGVASLLRPSDVSHRMAFRPKTVCSSCLHLSRYTRAQQHLLPSYESRPEHHERIDKDCDGLQASRQRTSRATLTLSAAATSPKEILMLGEHPVYACHTCSDLLYLWLP